MIAGALHGLRVCLVGEFCLKLVSVCLKLNFGYMMTVSKTDITSPSDPFNVWTKSNAAIVFDGETYGGLGSSFSDPTVSGISEGFTCSLSISDRWDL